MSTTSTGEQRRFMIERLRERPHSTNELRQMGIYYPPSRIKELRNQGYLIDTFYREETDSTGLTHRVNGGGKLFNELAKGTNLTQEQTALLKAFNQVNGYLIYKFSEVAEQIDQLNIERVEEQKTTDSKMN
ncbi:transcriptional regulator [Aggregatibacter actinomycetemcomitans serotype e str. SA2149]|nr:transcriptional regulator [Aggregatibacter actinomycetemcomitans serotype e str. SA2149]KYK79030.1 transcriptional regulator [Aggregatibacter actinomycetemcomitans SC383s]